MNALLDTVDQGELPGAAFDLPDAEGDQYNEGDERENREPRVLTRSPSGAARFAILGAHEIAHFIPVISCIGIMLLLRWFITHSEPDSAITTITMVKISAIIVQPPSDCGFICKKKII